MKWKVLSAVLVASAAVGSCNGGGGVSDAGPDAVEELIDLCSLVISSGSSCPKASPIICDPVCEAGGIAGGGCQCRESDAGPVWVCFNGECDVGCQNSSPLNPNCDAGPDAPNDAPNDATDSMADGAPDDAIADATTDAPAE